MSNFLPNALIDRMKRLREANAQALTAVASLPLARQAVLPNSAKPYAMDLSLGKPVGWWPGAHSLLDGDYAFANDPGYDAGAYTHLDSANLFIAYAIKYLGLTQSAIRGVELGAYTSQSAVVMSAMLDAKSLWLVDPAEEASYDSIKQGILAWGRNNTWIIPELLTHIALLPNYADLIQYHAPMVSADPFLEASKRSDQWIRDYVHLAEEKELRGLKSALTGLKAKGYLFYINRSDNTILDGDFIAKNMLAEGLESVRLLLDAAWEVEEYQSSESGCYSYRFGADSATGASFSLTIFYKAGHGEADKVKLEETLIDVVQDYKVGYWFAAPNNLVFEQEGKELYSFPKAFLNDYKLLSELFDKRYLGHAIADWKGEEWIPRQSLAWSVELSSNLPCVELEVDEALAFIHGEDIRNPSKGVKKGIYLVKYKGIGLGWLEIVANA